MLEDEELNVRFAKTVYAQKKLSLHRQQPFDELMIFLASVE